MTAEGFHPDRACRRHADRDRDRKDLPVKDLKEFIEFARKNEKTINQAHAGSGSVSHVTCVLLNEMMKIDPTRSPIRARVRR